MHLPTVFRPRLKPLARLIMLAGGLPLAVVAADQEAGHLEKAGAGTALTLALAPAASSLPASGIAQPLAEEPRVPAALAAAAPDAGAQADSPAKAVTPAQAEASVQLQAEAKPQPEANAAAVQAPTPVSTFSTVAESAQAVPAEPAPAAGTAVLTAGNAAEAAPQPAEPAVVPVAAPLEQAALPATLMAAASVEQAAVSAVPPPAAPVERAAAPGAADEVPGTAIAAPGPATGSPPADKSAPMETSLPEPRERALQTSTQLSVAPAAAEVIAAPGLALKIAAAPAQIASTTTVSAQESDGRAAQAESPSLRVATPSPMAAATPATDGPAAPSPVAAAQTALAPAGEPVAAAAPPASSAPPGAAAPVDPAAPAGERLSLKTDPEIKPERPADEQVPVFVQGLKISGQTGVQTTVEGDAELRKRASQIKADSITYWPPEDEMLATGNVRTLKNGDLFTGTELRLKLDAQTGYYMNVNYLLAGEKARGEAKRLDFLGQDAYNGEDATYTTCGPGNDDWFMKVGKLNLDFGRDVGEAEQAKIVFLGREIMYLPSMSFPLNDKRKSGFLTPSFGNSVIRGAEVLVPYYWNIAPNRDMTITERGMTKRGLQTGVSFRYLGETYKGTLSGEILPNDSLTKTTRSGFSLLHVGRPMDGLTVSADYNKVSDNAYFTDLASRVALTAQTNLNRELSATYNIGQGWYLQARTLSYQTLQDPLSPITVPYFRLPDVTFGYNKYDLGGLDLGLYTNYTRFSHATQVMGSRTYINPSISYPFITPGFYITPKVELSSTRYNLQELGAWQNGLATPANAQAFITRNLPIVSVDSGMTFERQANIFGKDYTQTLEPRLYYLRVPYRDQSNIPIFDTGAADFNFSQIFSNNRYSGYDRIADANQITAAISTRLLSSDTGAERLRFSLGQRYYFSTQRVTLPTETARTDRTSDFLAAVSGDIVPGVRFDSAVEYNPNAKQIERVSHGIRYSPEPGNTVSAAYRYQRSLLEQVDFAAQWRLAPRWYGVGRYNFSIRDGRVVEALGGFEYDGDCWVGRVVVQRTALATQKASTSIFFQIELNGLSRLGSNPLEVLRRAIPGYTKLNDNQLPDPRTLTNYE